MQAALWCCAPAELGWWVNARVPGKDWACVPLQTNSSALGAHLWASSGGAEPRGETQISTEDAMPHRAQPATATELCTLFLTLGGAAALLSLACFKAVTPAGPAQLAAPAPAVQVGCIFLIRRGEDGLPPRQLPPTPPPRRRRGRARRRHAPLLRHSTRVCLPTHHLPCPCSRPRLHLTLKPQAPRSAAGHTAAHQAVAHLRLSAQRTTPLSAPCAPCRPGWQRRQARRCMTSGASHRPLR